MVPVVRSTRLVWIGFGALLAFIAALLIGFSPAAEARQSMPSSAASLALITTTPTPSATPTATPVGNPQMSDIVCTPTLTANPSSVALYNNVSFTFDDGCVCSGNFACGFAAWGATMTSTGFDLTQPFANPPSTSFDAFSNAGGLIDVTVVYNGEKQVGNFYFTSNLTATTQVLVDPSTPTPTVTVTTTPTVTATPSPGYTTCVPSLSASDNNPAIGQAVTFTFTSVCGCPEPDPACYFAVYSRNFVTGDGFDFSAVEIGQGASGPITGIATTAGPTEVTVQYYGETTNGNYWSWTYQTASTLVTVQEPYVAPFACEQQGAVLTWNDVGANPYWVYRTSPGQPVQTWIGRTLGGTTFTDPNPVADANYFVHYAGIPRTLCADLGGPIDPGPSLSCEVNVGVITWDDLGQSRYWLYRSTPTSPAFTWIGRTLGETTFTDTNPVNGALYQVRFQGAAPIVCTIESEPPVAASFMCTATGSDLQWSDHSQGKYWIYRSVDGGQTYTWLGRTEGATAFTDSNPVAGALYQVHYAGIPRFNCTPGV